MKRFLALCLALSLLTVPARALELSSPSALLME